MENQVLKITKETVLMTDLDGTVMDLRHDPKMRRIDNTALYAFALFEDICPNQVVGVTGRDYPQVVQCSGNCRPFFPVITSNGADLRLPSGQVYSHPFSKEEEDFIEYAKRQMTAFSKEHPHLVTEVKERSIGYHSSAVEGFGSGVISCDSLMDMVSISSQHAYNLLVRLHKEAVSKNLPFKIAGAEATNSELHHASVNKADSIGWFSKHLPTLPQTEDWRHVVFCGDSLRGHGNDRDMAIRVRQNKGSVILVTNQDSNRIPNERSEAEPHFAVETPAELGSVLLHHVRHMIMRSERSDGLARREERVRAKGLTL